MAKIARYIRPSPVVLRSFYALVPIGTFWIVPVGEAAELYLDSSSLGSFPSLWAAARAVAEHRTGLDSWDQLTNYSGPGPLPDWGQYIVLGDGQAQ